MNILFIFNIPIYWTAGTLKYQQFGFAVIRQYNLQKLLKHSYKQPKIIVQHAINKTIPSRDCGTVNLFPRVTMELSCFTQPVIRSALSTSTLMQQPANVSYYYNRHHTIPSLSLLINTIRSRCHLDYYLQ